MQVHRGIEGTGWETGVFDDALLQNHSGRSDLVAWLWRPASWVSFGPRDRHHEGYKAAVGAAEALGYAAVNRSLGGRAVAANTGTVCFLVVGPARGTIEDRYDAVLTGLQAALTAFDLETDRTCPVESFCPGGYGLAATGKIVGLAQRVRNEVAAVGGILIVRKRSELVSVLSSVYAELDLPFSPTTVGSIEQAGVEFSMSQVEQTISRQFADTGLHGW